MDSQTTYLNYKVATSNGQGSRRCPANLAFLPSTWIDETRLYMKWRCNLGTVNIYVTDAVGHVVLRNIANCNFGEVTSWDISFWATNIYTLFGAPDKPCGVGRADANPKTMLPNDT